MYKALFWATAWAGRPFRNVHYTRKLIRWLAHKGYGDERPASGEFRWHHDRYGIKFLLHPHFHVDYQIIAFGTYDRAINNFIERDIKPGMVCLDAGANIGVMALHLAQKVGPTGSVHAFEPDPHIFQRLQQHVKRNKLQTIIGLHQVALSNVTGRSPLAVSDQQFPIQGLGSLVNRAHPQLVAEVEVETMALDDFASRERLERVDLVKIDIQGAEPLFLDGGRQTLERFRPDMLMEISPGDLQGCGRNSVDLLRQIEEMGYDVFELKKSGRVGARLHSSAIAPDYYKNAVLCRAKNS